MIASDRAKREMAAWKRQGQTEQVIYRPTAPALLTGERTVLVERKQNELKPGLGPVISITALNDDREGVPSDMFNRNDRIDVAERCGMALTARGIARIGQQDADFVTLEIV